MLSQPERSTDKPQLLYTRQTLISHAAYYALGQCLDFTKPRVGVSWHILADKARLNLLGAGNIPELDRIHYGGTSPITFSPAPDFKDNYKWSADCKNALGSLVVESLADYLDDIDRHLADSHSAPQRRVLELQRFAGTTVSPATYDIWSGIVQLALPNTVTMA